MKTILLTLLLLLTACSAPRTFTHGKIKYSIGPCVPVSTLFYAEDRRKLTNYDTRTKICLRIVNRKYYHNYEAYIKKDY